MITFQVAQEVVKKRIQEIEEKADIPLEIIEAATVEFEYGWLFCYQSEEYLRTGNKGAILGGNPPIIVDKLNSTVHTTGTGKAQEEYIKLYCKYRLCCMNASS